MFDPQKVIPVQGVVAPTASPLSVESEISVRRLVSQREGTTSLYEYLELTIHITELLHGEGVERVNDFELDQHGA